MTQHTSAAAETTPAQPSNGKQAAKPAEEVLLQPPPLPAPPDGGWGWAVVFASFMVHVITDGVTYSYGVFHTEFLKYFDTTDQAASWVASCLVGVTYCSGPISSFFVNKFGCRTVTVVGTILASGCLLASVWVQSLPMLILTAGIGTGLGFGLIYLPAIVSVTVYFEKYRSLATGIAVCGSGLGTVMFAPFISYLIWFYGGYKYSMMILSGIVLNCIVLGIMFRPLEPSKSSECLPLEELTSSGKQQQQRQQQQQQQQQQEPTSTGEPASKASQGAAKIRLALSQPILGGTGKEAQAQVEPAPGAGDPFPRAYSGAGGVMNRSDVFLRSSIHSIRKRSESLTNSEENVRFRLSLRSLPNGAAQRLHTLDDASLCHQADAQHQHQHNIIKRMLHFSLLRDPLFIIFTLSNFCTSIGFNVPYVYLIPQAESISIDKDTASMLLSVIGIANTFGRVILGYVSDKPWVNRLLVYNVCLTICGLSTALCPFCPNFTMLAIYASVYGFAAGAYVGLTSVCLVDLVGLDRLTNAFGLVLLSQGIASFLGPPIAGALKDATGSYHPGFYVAGTMIAISGLMLFVIPPIQKRILRKSEQLQRLHGITA